MVGAATTANAQTSAPTVAPAPASPAAIPGSRVKALQEALSEQGMTVTADGVLDEETRAAIRKYQSQHHLPVTGEPDQATLDKRSEEHTSELQSLMRISYAVFCLKKKKNNQHMNDTHYTNTINTTKYL